MTRGAGRAANSYFYPDVLVTCHPADHASRLVKTHPKLLVEVFLPSTAAYDRAASSRFIA